MAAPGRDESLRADRWRRIEELFHAAIDLDESSRCEYLESACGDDASLRRHVESLIFSVQEPDSSGVLTGAVGRAARNTLELSPGERAGAYRITRKIGAGGMGGVYLASRADDQYQQNVAIKFLAGPVTGGVLAHFRLERQILAGLEHPHIARLLDGGEADGVPYLVMEYVDGVPLDEYVRRHKPSLADILKLFCDICGAVSFAHGRLVVHRDIKPTNILVTADGVPKLLDFGIAKILASDAPGGLTRATERVMTPEYASPEQVRGDAITTATDVYSLGLVLYEIVAGERPLPVDSARPLDTARTICEQEAPKPSAVAAGKRRRELKGDMDTIVLKALRKEPSRRYVSVDAFADDVRRYLEGYPVRARRDNAAYRAGKFLRRHRIPSVVATVALALLTFTVFRIRAERERAQGGFQEVREMANSFLFEFEGAIRNLPGSTAARRLVVARGLEYLARLEKIAGNDTGLERELADAYSKIGHIQYDRKPPSLYDVEAARESALKEVALRERLAANGTAQDRARLASAYFRLVEMESPLRHREAAEAARRRALSLAAGLPKDASDADIVAALIARQIELMHANPGDAAAQFAHGEEAVALADRATTGGKGERPRAIRAVSARVEVVNLMVNANGRLDDKILAPVVALGRSAESLLRDLFRQAPDDVDARGLADRLDEAFCRMRSPDPAEALAACRRVEATLRPVVAADSQDLSSFLSLSASYGEIGRYLKEAGKPDQAAKELEQGLAMTEAAWRLRAGDPEIRRHLILYCEELGDMMMGLRRPAKARDFYQRALNLIAPWEKDGRLLPRLPAMPEELRHRLADATARANAN